MRHSGFRQRRTSVQNLTNYAALALTKLYCQVILDAPSAYQNDRNTIS